MLFIHYTVKWKNEEPIGGKCLFKDGCCTRLYELAIPANLESVVIDDQFQWIGGGVSANTALGVVLMHAQCVRNVQNALDKLS